MIRLDNTPSDETIIRLYLLNTHSAIVHNDTLYDEWSRVGQRAVPPPPSTDHASWLVRPEPVDQVLLVDVHPEPRRRRQRLSESERQRSPFQYSHARFYVGHIREPIRLDSHSRGSRVVRWLARGERAAERSAGPTGKRTPHLRRKHDDSAASSKYGREVIILHCSYLRVHILWTEVVLEVRKVWDGCTKMHRRCRRNRAQGVVR